MPQCYHNGGSGRVRTFGTLARPPRYEVGAIDQSAADPPQNWPGKTPVDLWWAATQNKNEAALCAHTVHGDSLSEARAVSAAASLKFLRSHFSSCFSPSYF